MVQYEIIMILKFLDVKTVFDHKVTFKVLTNFDTYFGHFV